MEATLSGRYRLVERLGSGGMSVVWRAYDEVLGRSVAIKLLAPEFAADEDFRDRIRREAQAAARLTDPHITNVYDYGEAADGTPYVVMELVHGVSLAERLRRGPIGLPVLLTIGAQIAGALATAHARGLVHRDITPANVMLSETGVKVVDFGISALAGEHGGPVVGTPAYFAPEQRAGAPATPATDVYALALILTRAMPPGAVLAPNVSVLLAESLVNDPGARPSSATVAHRLAVAAAAARPESDGPSFTPGRATPGNEPTAMLPMAPMGRRGTQVHAGHSTLREAPAPLPVPLAPPPAARRHRRWPWLVVLTLALIAVFVTGSRLSGVRGTPIAAPVAPPTSASPAPSMSCAVDYKVTDLLVGFTAQVTITNSGPVAIGGWTLTFNFPDSQKLKVGWAGRWSQSGKQITAKDLVYNRQLDPGKSTEIGFVGSYSGANEAPAGFTLNKVPCQPK